MVTSAEKVTQNYGFISIFYISIVTADICSLVKKHLTFWTGIILFLHFYII
jgi:hypothetical protein